MGPAGTGTDREGGVKAHPSDFVAEFNILMAEADVLLDKAIAEWARQHRELIDDITIMTTLGGVLQAMGEDTMLGLALAAVRRLGHERIEAND